MRTNIPHPTNTQDASVGDLRERIDDGLAMLRIHSISSVAMRLHSWNNKHPLSMRGRILYEALHVDLAGALAHGAGIEPRLHSQQCVHVHPEGFLDP